MYRPVVRGSLQRRIRRPAGAGHDLYQIRGRKPHEHRHRHVPARPAGGRDHRRGAGRQRPLPQVAALLRRRGRQRREDRSQAAHSDGAPEHPGRQRLPAHPVPGKLCRHGPDRRGHRSGLSGPGRGRTGDGHAPLARGRAVRDHEGA